MPQQPAAHYIGSLLGTLPPSQNIWVSLTYLHLGHTHSHTQTRYEHATCAMHTQCTDMLHKCMFGGMSAPHPLGLAFILLSEITE